MTSHMVYRGPDVDALEVDDMPKPAFQIKQIEDTDHWEIIASVPLCRHFASLHLGNNERFSRRRIEPAWQEIDTWFMLTRQALKALVYILETPDQNVPSIITQHLSAEWDRLHATGMNFSDWRREGR